MTLKPVHLQWASKYRTNNHEITHQDLINLGWKKDKEFNSDDLKEEYYTHTPINLYGSTTIYVIRIEENYCSMHVNREDKDEVFYQGPIPTLKYFIEIMTENVKTY